MGQRESRDRLHRGDALTSSTVRGRNDGPTRSAAEIVQRQVDAYNAHDLEAFLATYADDAVITSAGTGQVLARGRTALREIFGGLFQRSPTVNARVAGQRIEGDSVVLLHEIITGFGADKPDPWDFGWVRYEVEGGLIKAVRFP